MELISPFYVNMIALIAIVSSLAIAAWWLIGLYLVQRREAEKDMSQVSFPAGLRELNSRVPPVLVIFFTFIGLSLIGYVLYIWLGGVTY